MRKFVLGLGVPALLCLGVAAPVASATAPPTSPPTSGVPEGDFVLPEDWTSLIDDTNTITVAVPNTWIDIDTAPKSNTDGTLAPRITAATDLGVFVGTFDAPGVDFWAGTYTSDLETLMDQAGLTSGCRRKNVTPYDDGAFVGLHGVWESCGPTFGALWHQVVASPPSHSFTFILQIQITSDADMSVVDYVLQSFNFTPEGAAVTGPVTPPTLDETTTTSGPSTTSGPTTTSAPSTTSPDPTVAVSTTVAALPPVSGTVPADSRQLIDDLGVLQVSVPAEWSAFDTSPRVNDDGSDRPWVAATTDLQLFLPPTGTSDTFSVPGVLYAALPFTADVSGTLERFSYAGQCTDGGVQPYDDGAFTGLTQTFSDCGSTTTRIINIVASPADESYTVFLLLQLTSESPDEDYDTVMSSFTMFDQSPGAG